ncbi:MAG: AzlD domain-containing protein [Actinomycetia bacterium]|nr:AzlD domain-containing protein [Actinomycetes bacterium]
MTASAWVLVAALMLASALERLGPWLWARRRPPSERAARWLEHLAPAAFAALVVADLPRSGSPAVVAALAAAAVVGWTTRHLGWAVVAAVAAAALGRSLAGW